MTKVPSVSRAKRPEMPTSAGFADRETRSSSERGQVSVSVDVERRDQADAPVIQHPANSALTKLICIVDMARGWTCQRHCFSLCPSLSSATAGSRTGERTLGTGLPSTSTRPSNA